MGQGGVIVSAVLATIIAVLVWQMGVLWTENERLERELGEVKAQAVEETEDLGRDVLNCNARANNLVAMLEEVREELASRKAELERARERERVIAYQRGVEGGDVDVLTALLERDGWVVGMVDGRKVVQMVQRESEVVRTGSEVISALRVVAADAVDASLGVGGGDAVLHVVASACPHLSALRLMGVDATDAGFIALGKGCPLLADVSVYPWVASHSQISNVGLAALASPYLTSLAIPSAAVDDDGLADLARSAPNLSSLRVGGENSGVTDAGIASFLAASPHLVELDLSSSRVGDASLLALAEGRCGELTTLILYNVENVTDAGVSALASCEGLTTLSLTGTSVTDLGLASLVHGAPDIRVLDLGMTKVTDGGLAAAIEAMPNLTSLDVHWTLAGDATMGALAAHTSLSKLLASHSDSVSDAGLEALARMSTLTEVHLGGGVTDTGISALAKGNSGLTLVDLTWASDVGDGALVALVEHCPDLSVLRLDGTSVTDASLVALGSGAPNLTQLKLSDTSVTDQGLIALADPCPPGLTYLSLGNTLVGDDGVAALASCSALETLWLVKTKVGDRGAEALAPLCPGLQHVWFDWSNVGSGAVSRLRESCPGAQVSN